MSLRRDKKQTMTGWAIVLVLILSLSSFAPGLTLAEDYEDEDEEEDLPEINILVRYGQQDAIDDELKIEAAFDQGLAFNLNDSIDYEEDLLEAMNSDEAPDIFLLNADLRQRAQEGWTLPLDDLIAARELDLSDFAPVALDAVRVDGTIHGLPTEMDGLTMGVDTRSLASWGLELPGAEWNWDQFIAVAQACSDAIESKGAAKFCFVVPPTLPFYAEWFQRSGASLFGPDGDSLMLDDPGSVSAMEKLQELQKAYIISPSTITMETYNYAFGNGLSIFTALSTTRLPSMEKYLLDDAVGDFVFMPLPEMPGDNHPLVNVEAYCINAQAQDPERCFDLIARLSDSDCVIANWDEIPAMIPARLSAQQEYLARYPKLDLTLVLDRLNAGTPYRRPANAELLELVSETLASAREEGAQVSELMQGGQAKGQEFLK